jgi:transaldolase
MNTSLADLTRHGVSVWLDDLSRRLIDTGELRRLVETSQVTGVTSNPTIFAAALSGGTRYADDIHALAARGATAGEAALAVTTDDVRAAADVLRPVFETTGGRDGLVSIEVDPGLAHDTARTVEAARHLWRTVDRPNIMIKIPATPEGLPAVTAAVAEQISVNVTLIFSVERYRAVMDAYLSGLEAAREAGHDLSTIASVASFFVSRVDTEVDRRLDALRTRQAAALRGRAAVANARLAYRAYEEVVATQRWRSLADAGARTQRPLWASTGVKDPSYPDTLYVTELVAPHTVNTMPTATLRAVADHGAVTGDTIRGRYDESSAVLDELAGLGISYDDVVAVLEREGVEKFVTSWADLLRALDAGLSAGADGS